MMESRRRSRVVDTKYGQVAGFRMLKDHSRGVDAFLGIPYAKPPIGHLRFKKPECPDKWNGVYEAFRHVARGFQKDSSYVDPELDTKMDEHNLYLNVFTPTWASVDRGGFPVTVYVHGGAFVCGGAERYGDESICRHLVTKDVVVVTIQYRLGYLGFYSTGDSVCPGNLGLWDQTAALQWIQDNIAAFGGDKDNVTVIGHSAGAACVEFLSLSPHSNCLFSKMCILGGSAFARWALAPETVDNCRRMAEKLGVHEEDSARRIDRLREVPAEEFSVAINLSDSNGHMALDVSPVLDGDFLPGKTVAELREKAPLKPTIIGICKQEGTLFASAAPVRPEGIQHLVERMIPVEGRQEHLQDLLILYLKGPSPDSDNGQDLRRAFIEAFSDKMFNIPLMQHISACLALSQKPPLFSFQFDIYNASSIGPLANLLAIQEATHGTEIMYLLGKSIFHAPYSLTNEDIRIVDIFTSTFSNFAKSGNPNGEGNDETEWKSVTGEQPELHLVFNSDGTRRMAESFFDGRIRKWMRALKES